MKRLLIFFTLSILMAVESKSKGKKKLSHRLRDIYYITNWGQYQMPKSIKGADLKNVIHKMGLVNRAEWCPFEGDENKCRDKSIGEMVSKIIKDVVANTPDPNNDEDNSNSNESIEDNSNIDEKHNEEHDSDIKRLRWKKKHQKPKRKLDFGHPSYLKMFRMLLDSD